MVEQQLIKDPERTQGEGNVPATADLKPASCVLLLNSPSQKKIKNKNHRPDLRTEQSGNLEQL